MEGCCRFLSVPSQTLTYFISSAHRVLCHKIFFKKPGNFSSLCSFPNNGNKRNSLVEVDEVLSFFNPTFVDFIRYIIYVFYIICIMPYLVNIF